MLPLLLTPMVWTYTIKHNGIKYLGHRMVFAREKPYIYVAYDKNNKLEASHLCGNLVSILGIFG